jgi:hypothetical protein
LIRHKSTVDKLGITYMPFGNTPVTTVLDVYRKQVEEEEQLLREADFMLQWAEQEIRYGDDMPKHLTLARIEAWQKRFRELKEKYG